MSNYFQPSHLNEETRRWGKKAYSLVPKCKPTHAQCSGIQQNQGFYLRELHEVVHQWYRHQKWDWWFQARIRSLLQGAIRNQFLPTSPIHHIADNSCFELSFKKWVIQMPTYSHKQCWKELQQTETHTLSGFFEPCFRSAKKWMYLWYDWVSAMLSTKVFTKSNRDPLCSFDLCWVNEWHLDCYDEWRW